MPRVTERDNTERLGWGTQVVLQCGKRGVREMRFNSVMERGRAGDYCRQALKNQPNRIGGLSWG